MARPKPELTLTDDERQKLTTWANRPKSSQRLALRARIVLACADEPSNKAVANRLDVCNATVGTWRNRFVAKRLVGLYLAPPEKAIVLSVDEKSQVQSLDRTQPILQMTPGQAERGTHDYVRHGVTSLFAALNLATGQVIGKCHRHQEFLKFLDHVDATLVKEPGVSIHIVLDNDATHKTPAVKRWLLRHPAYHLHFIPTSSSWLNQVERFFAEITEKRIRRGAFKSVAALERAIADYLAAHNADPKPFAWVADADAILDRIKRFANGLPTQDTSWRNCFSVNSKLRDMARLPSPM